MDGLFECARSKNVLVNGLKLLHEHGVFIDDATAKSKQVKNEKQKGKKQTKEAKAMAKL